MTARRPFLPRLVVLLGIKALGALAEWGARWEEAGADGLALAGNPGDPAAADLVEVLRGACALPLEVHVPPEAVSSPAWVEALGEKVDWVVPGVPLPQETARALVAAGIGVAWPLGYPIPTEVARVHGIGGVPGPERFAEAPPGAERSLTLREAEPDGLLAEPGPDPWSGADTLVLPEEMLAGQDPATALGRWRR